jgi:ankyrin repeat protein
MTERRPPTPLTRAVAWLLFLSAIGAWLFSAQLFPGNGRLYDAIADGDAARVRQLLAAGADPNSQSSPLTLTRTSTRRYMVPPLVFALRRNAPEVALALVEGGADPNARDLNAKSALTLATEQRMPAVVRALLEHGARPLAENSVGR